MSAQLHPEGVDSLHIVLPEPWKGQIAGFAKRNRRSLSEEVRETLRLAYGLETPAQDKRITLPPGLAKAS